MIKKVLLILMVILFAFSCNSPSNPSGSTGDGGSTGNGGSTGDGGSTGNGGSTGDGGSTGGVTVDKNKGIEQFAGEYKGNTGIDTMFIVINEKINNGFLFLLGTDYDETSSAGRLTIEELNKVKSEDALTYSMPGSFSFKFNNDKSVLEFNLDKNYLKLNRAADLDSSKGIEQFGTKYQSFKMKKYGTSGSEGVFQYTLTINGNNIKIEEYNETTSKTVEKYNGSVSGKGAFYLFDTDKPLQFYNNGDNCVVHVLSYNNDPIVFKKLQ